MSKQNNTKLDKTKDLKILKSAVDTELKSKQLSAFGLIVESKFAGRLFEDKGVIGFFTISHSARSRNELVQFTFVYIGYLLSYLKNLNRGHVTF